MGGRHRRAVVRMRRLKDVLIYLKQQTGVLDCDYIMFTIAAIINVFRHIRLYILPILQWLGFRI